MSESTGYRDYTSPDVLPAVRDNYRKMRSRQTFDYVLRMHEKYLTFDRPMSVWEAMAALDDFVDLSDPDMDLPNVQHLMQTAEGIRADDRPDWMQLVGLIHDLGKVMYRWGCDEDGTSLKEQWGLVGDVFLVGCALPETTIFAEFNELNPDMQDSRYRTPEGVYSRGCGIEACTTAWGHDEYLYQVLRHHPGNRIPEAGMIMIRYHSFYPWHEQGSYEFLMREGDYQYRDWVRDFNQYDLYTKSRQTFDLDEIRARYQPLIDRYLGSEPICF